MSSLMKFLSAGRLASAALPRRAPGAFVRKYNALVSESKVLKHFEDSNNTLTKIVATIGPVSEQQPMLHKLCEEGLKVMRINFSHATYEEALLRTTNLRSYPGFHASKGKDFNMRAILLDTQGPEIRTGSLVTKDVLLESGKEIRLTTDKEWADKGTAECIYINYPNLAKVMKAGGTVLLDDGLIRLSVLRVEGTNVYCRVMNTGTLGRKKGVNLPGTSVDLPALTDKDRTDLRWGIEHDLDYIAASFVRSASDVTAIKEYVDKIASEKHGKEYKRPLVISKIESTEGMEKFEEILEVSDGIMVARGDLGVEIPLEKVFAAQKWIVERCNQVGKPVIVATQMLETMMKNPRPTRAEICDVGNAVLDGTDAVMLSGESAQGKYPAESVGTMIKVLKETDELVAQGYLRQRRITGPASPSSTLEAVCASAVSTAKNVNAACVIVIGDDNGAMTRAIAKQRPVVPVVTLVDEPKMGRHLQLFRAVMPLYNFSSPATPSPEDAISYAKEAGYCRQGEVVLVLESEKDGAAGSAPATFRIEKA